MAKKTTTKISVIVGILYPTTHEIIELVNSKCKKFDQVIIMHLNDITDPMYKGSEILSDMFYLQACGEFTDPKVSTCKIDVNYTPEADGTYTVNNKRFTKGTTFVSELFRRQNIIPGTEPVYEITILDNIGLPVFTDWTKYKVTTAEYKQTNHCAEILADPDAHLDVLADNSKRIVRRHRIVTNLDKPSLDRFLADAENNYGFTVYHPDSLYIDEFPTTVEDLKIQLNAIKTGLTYMEQSEHAQEPLVIIPYDPLLLVIRFASFVDLNREHYNSDHDSVRNEVKELLDEIFDLLRPLSITIVKADTDDTNEVGETMIGDKYFKNPAPAEIYVRYNTACEKFYGFHPYFLSEGADPSMILPDNMPETI